MTKNPNDLFHDVHLGILEHNALQGCNIVTVHGTYAYYHYLCDGEDDRGWGCGYRTCQTICSWIHYRKRNNHNGDVKNETHRKKIKGNVPAIAEIQEILVRLGDKNNSFQNSKEWIGSVEISMCIDDLYDVPCKLLHVAAGQLSNHVNQLCEHFKKYGSPIMMGGDSDNSSKGILGIAVSPEAGHTYFLVLDPHCSTRYQDPENLLREGWVSWRPLRDFDEASFYNLCMPMLS